MEKASGVNIEEKSGVGAPKAVRCCLHLVLATPATALVPNCNSFAVPLDQPVTWRGGRAK